MINVRSKLLLAFGIVIIISVVSSGISFVGYESIMSAVNNINYSKVNEDKIHSLKDMASKEEQILSKSVTHLDTAQKTEFDKLNTDIKARISDMLNASNSKGEQLYDSDKKELGVLSDLSSKYSEAFNKIVPEIESNKEKNLQTFFKKQGDGFTGTFELEQKLKDSVNLRVDNKLKDSILSLLQLKGISDNTVGDIQKLQARINDYKTDIDKVDSYVGLQSDDSKNAEAADLVKKLETGLDSLTTDSNKVNDSILNTQASIIKIKLDDLQKDMALLSNINRLIYWTQKKYYSQSESVILLDEKFDNYNEATAKVNEFIQIVANLVSGQEKKAINDIDTSNKAMDAGFGQVLSEVKRLNSNQLLSLYTNSEDILNKYNESADKLEVSFKGYLAEDFKTSDKIKFMIYCILAGFVLFSIVVGMLIALLISRNITNPIKGMINLLSKAEKGDLTVRTLVNRKDEIGELGEKVNNVLEGHQKIVGQVITTNKDIGTLKQKLFDLFSQSKDNASKMSGGIKNVVDNIKAGAPGSNNNLNGVNQLASDFKGVSEATIKVVNDGMKAIEAAETGEKSVEEAEKVIKRVTATVQKIAGSINELEVSSEKIGDITNTITDIASRTNLLALNAAIEASRAGQQGKGFAVLADEIRKLAEASNRSAGEIKKQIKEIQSKIQYAVDNMNVGVSGVAEGVVKINNVKSNISEVIESIRFVVESVKSTAAVAYKQSSTTDELVRTMDSMAKAVSENVSTSEGLGKNIEAQSKVVKEIEVLSKKLDEASANLSEIIKQIKV
jgi:methyl-accepting chemotaxis protein